MTPIIVGNWKMQLGITESVQLATDLRDRLGDTPRSIAVVLCPSFPALPFIRQPLEGSGIHLGAQDVFWKDRGAYTGQVSPLVLHEMGAEYCIVGHSERRALGETDSQVARKTLAVLAHGIRPIICIGESAEDRARGDQEVVIRRQLEAAFRSALPPTRNQVVYIAYEPIWAVSPNDAADPDEANTMRRFIRRTLIDLFPAELVESSFVVLYGGSVDPENISAYLGPDRFKGALVGKASLQAEQFSRLIQTVARDLPGV